jgi:hypothetical protein
MCCKLFQLHFYPNCGHLFNESTANFWHWYRGNSKQVGCASLTSPARSSWMPPAGGHAGMGFFFGGNPMWSPMLPPRPPMLQYIPKITSLVSNRSLSNRCHDTWTAAHLRHSTWRCTACTLTHPHSAEGPACVRPGLRGMPGAAKMADGVWWSNMISHPIA